jgi:hypothetical protein
VYDTNRENGIKVLFIGDSNMEQYAPRINQIIDKDLEKKISKLYMIGYQENISILNCIMLNTEICNNSLKTIVELIKKNKIQKIIVAASWINYEQNLITATAQVNLIKFFDDLDVKKLIIIKNMPRGFELDPNNLISGNRINGFAIKSKIEEFNYLVFSERHSEINRVLEGLKFKNQFNLIDPIDYLCNKNACPIYAVKDGQIVPYYKDSNHMTATYAKENAIFIDGALSD